MNPKQRKSEARMMFGNGREKLQTLDRPNFTSIFSRNTGSLRSQARIQDIFEKSAANKL